MFQEWVALGNAILETILSIDSAEKEAFVLLRGEVSSILEETNGV